LRIATGTSGGGICALLLARALHYRFSPAKPSAEHHTWAANPFYSVWVDDIDITDFLENTDLVAKAGGSPPAVAALLNGKILEAVAEKGLKYCPQVNAPPQPCRPYVFNPLPIVVTYTHLTGVPYKVVFRGEAGRSEYFINHADYIRFYADYSGTPTFDSRAPAPDGKHINRPPAPWTEFAQYALGTSAFPVGLPARFVNRDVDNYKYRFVYDPAEGNYAWLAPDWENFYSLEADAPPYKFASLDGGCTDNEPIALARQVLDGIGGEPAKLTSTETSRAVILVDPFADAPKTSAPKGNLTLTSLLGPTVSMFVQSNRFATADLVQFLHPDVYNRLLVTPRRSNPTPKDKKSPDFLTGGDALCGAGLGGFLGFIFSQYRHHDFMLGRRNCQAFLSWSLTLHNTNPVFAGPRPAVPKLPDGVSIPEGECPVIPLYGTAVNLEPEPVWPRKGSFDATSLEPAIKARADQMLHRIPGFLKFNIAEEVGFAAVRGLLAAKITAKVIEKIESEMKDKALL
jgi:hypothetical protein